MTTLHLVPPAYLSTHQPAFWTAHAGHASVALGVAVLIVLAVGVAAGVGFSTVLRRKPAIPAPDPSQPPSAKPQHAEAVAGQRAALITGMLIIRGLSEDPQVADVIDDSLRTAGVTVFDPTGHTKDPHYHRIDHTEPAAHPGQVDTIARTLTPGYIDDGRVLQPADVVVYR